MKRLTATLIAEGTSDQALIPLIEFVLDEHCPIPHVTTFAANLPSSSLSRRISVALDLYPCDLLFVHRDADRVRSAEREREILAAVGVARVMVKAVCVVPVRMTETWLLLDSTAIRRAAGNPEGKVRLPIPVAEKLETNADPKALLFDLLERASELGPNRLRRFDRNRARRQVSGFMEDRSTLRKLPSFVRFESQVQSHFQSTAEQS